MLAFTNRHCYLQAQMSKKTSRESTPERAGLTPRKTKFKMQFQLTDLPKTALFNYSIAKLYHYCEIFVRNKR